MVRKISIGQERKLVKRGISLSMMSSVRAFMLRVAKKESWNVAVGIRDLLDDDPMEVFFQENLASARQSAKNSHPRQDDKSEMLRVSFANVLGEWKSMLGQQYFQQSGQPSFALGGIPTYGKMLQYPTLEGDVEALELCIFLQRKGPYCVRLPTKEIGVALLKTALIVSWLKNKILQFPRGVRLLALENTPKQFEFTNEELLWVNQESIEGSVVRNNEKDNKGQFGRMWICKSSRYRMLETDKEDKIYELIVDRKGRNYCPGTVRPEKTVQQSGLETNCSENRLVNICLKRAENLAFQAVNKRDGRFGAGSTEIPWSYSEIGAQGKEANWQQDLLPIEN
ncbi:2655_t:CDS:2 [Gigaspora margarita]|uniref:2655_t:CDS:1 n=1 Tax=Gigaspora margarita TaxID=4874 RepID=A0ABN7UDT8_GIGMA|nr:2655_t:CDS:2 [Gigaspora margarita]